MVLYDPFPLIDEGHDYILNVDFWHRHRTLDTSRKFDSGHQTEIIWENGSIRNRENLQYKKPADSVLLSLSLFMRTNGKCNHSHAP